MFDHLDLLFQDYMQNKILSFRLPSSVDLWKPFLKKLIYENFEKIVLDIEIKDLEIFLNKVCNHLKIKTIN